MPAGQQIGCNAVLRLSVHRRIGTHELNQELGVLSKAPTTRLCCQGQRGTSTAAFAVRLIFLIPLAVDADLT